MADLLEDRGYHLELEPAVLEYLADVGYDPNFGARPLKRAIHPKRITGSPGNGDTGWWFSGGRHDPCVNS